MHALLVLLLVTLCFQSALDASDWPQFLGPTRNGVYDGPGLLEHWPSSGPPVTWQKAIGHGFSGPVVADHKLILFHRLGDEETIDCLDAHTSKSIWKFAYPTTYQDDFGFDDGPRATPCVSGNRLYTFGAQGMLHCLDLTSGKKLWGIDLKTEFQAENGFFGMACSPLVEGNTVLLNIGGAKGAGIVALDAATGKLLWKTSDDEASYSSPIAATIGGQRLVLFLTRNGFIAADPLNGRICFQYPWHSRNRTSVNAATPLVLGDTVFISACYGTGALLLRIHDQELEKIWSGDDLLSNHYATCIEKDGFLYGIHGRTDPGYNPGPKLRCVDIKSRKLVWETDGIGAATLTLAGNRLLILKESGELVEAPALPEGFRPTNHAQILHSQVRAFPALADGFFYARSKDQLICVDLNKKE
ncbi:MAG TPA: PQQ-binding-like beta-propeller repeat protein [Candidatus Limnocylindrales bacterium]|jgi:outer membrane protein assembly factor BamB|nr:PQQ-binding-like beta-propeller repeat protein [Candidatus Limnocylindrales bacterium]